jgi:hypothetical protein
LGGGGGGSGEQKPPIWNYKNLAGRKAVPNSQKDPFYHERAKFIEERRQRRLEYYQNLAKKNGEKYNEYMQKQQKGQRSNNDDDFTNDESMTSRNDQTASRRQSTASSMSISSNQTYQNDFKNNSNNSGPSKPQQESIFNLLGKNLAANTIYEEDEENQTNHHRQNYQKHQATNFNSNVNEPTQRNQSQVSNQQNHIKNVNSRLDDYSDTGFVPFMRTNEFLDPTHAGSPIPPSRESSAVKENREKARQVF